MFSLFERINYQYIRTNFRSCCSTAEAQTFRYGFSKKYLQTAHVFLFRENKLSLEQNLQTVATEARTFRFGFSN